MAEVFTVRARFVGQKPDRSWAYVGETFTVPGGLLSGRWMEVLDAPEPVPAAPADRDTAIMEAIGRVPESEYTQSGKPEVDAINDLVELDPIVTAAERDRIWSAMNAD